MRLKNLFVSLMSITFVVVFVVLWSFFSKQNIRNEVSNIEKNVVNMLEENADIVDFLENTIYSYEEDILVRYDNSNVEFSINKKNEKMDPELENFLVSLFENFKCEYLCVKNEKNVKSLVIFLGTVKLSKNNVFCHSLIYSPNKSFDNEIYPNWYYDVFFYT